MSIKKSGLKKMLAVLFFVLVSFAFFLFSYFHIISYLEYESSNGVLDLSSIQNVKQWTVNLKGKWEFIPNQLLEPKDSFPENSIILEEPQKLYSKILKYNKKNSNSIEYGTFRLKVKLPPDFKSNQVLTLRILAVHSALKGYVDETQFFSTEKLDFKKRNFEWGFSSYYYTFKPQSKEVVILIQTSLKKAALQGLRGIFILGTPSHIFRQAGFLYGLQLFSFGILLAMAIYHIALFFSGRHGIQIFFLGISCFFFSYRSQLSSERILRVLYSDSFWSVLTIFDVIFIVLGLIFLWYYFIFVYPNRRIKILDAIGISSHILMLFLYLFLSNKTIAVYYYLAVVILTFAYFIFLISSGFKLKIQGTALQLIGIFGFLALVFLELYSEYYVKSTMYLINTSGLGFAFYLYLNLYGISVRSSDMRLIEKKQTAALKQSVKDRSIEVERINKELLNSNKKLEKVNRTLKELARTDHLTGLNNRQEFSRREEKIESAGDNRPIVLYIDMDNFKFYNDFFGHSIGDAILVRFAGILKVMAGPGNSIFRMGGDEFVILVNSSDIEYAKKISRNILKDISSQKFLSEIEALGEVEAKNDFGIEISCSIGICKPPKDKLFMVSELVDFADCAMREAKQLGKNRYVVLEEK